MVMNVWYDPGRSESWIRGAQVPPAAC